MKAVVLAAGEGVRLQPITATRPKHLIRLGGKAVLEYCFDALKASGIVEVVVVTHYMGDAIRQYFGDGERLGLKISYVEQTEMLGTGNAVSVVAPYVDDDFVLVYGDLLFAPEAVADVLRLRGSRSSEPPPQRAAKPETSLKLWTGMMPGTIGTEIPAARTLST